LETKQLSIVDASDVPRRFEAMRTF
jgi:hypothetical protein